jgi:hypothetical protein
MRVWKIRRYDGKFSNGGTRPKFTEKGKTWHEPHHVQAHIRAISNDFHRHGNTSSDRTNLKTPSETYAGCVVVEYHLQEFSSAPVQGWVDEVEGEKIKRYGKL